MTSCVACKTQGIDHFLLDVGKYTITDDNHTDWISCVRFSPNQKDPLIVSAGWDKLVKVGVRSR